MMFANCFRRLMLRMGFIPLAVLKNVDCERPTATAQTLGVGSPTEDPESLTTSPSLRIRIPRTVSCENCADVCVLKPYEQVTPDGWTCRSCEDGHRSPRRFC